MTGYSLLLVEWYGYHTLPWHLRNIGRKYSLSVKRRSREMIMKDAALNKK